MVRRADVEGLTEVVRGLLEDPGRGAEVGRHCQKWVVERFDEDQVVERLRTIYQRLGVAA